MDAKPLGTYVYPWFLQCTRHSYGCTPTPTLMGKVFTGAGTGSGKKTRGLPVSYLNDDDNWAQQEGTPFLSLQT